MIKNKNIILIIVFLLSSFFASAQVENKYIKEDYNKEILIFPFNESKYINDASDLWTENSDMDRYELRAYLRNQLNRMLQISMADSCKPMDLLQSYTTEARNDLLGIYTSINYKMKERSETNSDKEKKSLKDRLFKNKQKKDTIAKTGLHRGEIREYRSRNKNKFLHVTFSNENFIENVCQKKGFDRILFINQLEIRGVYGDPYITGNPDAIRKIKVHYSYFDSKGKLLHGNYASVDIPFNLKDPELVVEKYYSAIVRQILSNTDFSE